MLIWLLVLMKQASQLEMEMMHLKSSALLKAKIVTSTDKRINPNGHEIHGIKEIATRSTLAAMGMPITGTTELRSTAENTKVTTKVTTHHVVYTAMITTIQESTATERPTEPRTAESI